MLKTIVAGFTLTFSSSLLMVLTSIFESFAIILSFLPTVKTDLVAVKFHFFASSAILPCKYLSRVSQLQNSM